MARKDITDMVVCKAIEKRTRQNHSPFLTEILQEETGEPLKVVYAALRRAWKHGLIEYGVSIRTAWLTDKGKELLKSLSTSSSREVLK